MTHRVFGKVDMFHIIFVILCQICVVETCGDTQQAVSNSSNNINNRCGMVQYLTSRREAQEFAAKRWSTHAESTPWCEVGSP